jgi:hypothetical protein
MMLREFAALRGETRRRILTAQMLAERSRGKILSRWAQSQEKGLWH